MTRSIRRAQFLHVSLIAALAALTLTGCSSIAMQWTPPPCVVPDDAAAGADCGPRGVAESERVLHDPDRGRDIPIKVYEPVPRDPSPRVVIFSHGLGNSHEGYRYLGRYWASHGFVSVHLSHSGTNRTTRLERGRVYLLSAFFQRSKRRDRIADIAWVADRVARGELTAAAVPSAIGFAGHSLGALSVLAAHHTLPSARAVIAISPPAVGFWNKWRHTTPDVAGPTLFIDGGEEESLVDTLRDGVRDVFIVELPAAEHETFSDDEEEPRTGRESDIAAVQRVTTAFWKAYLGGDDEAARDVLAACVRDPGSCDALRRTAVAAGGDD